MKVKKENQENLEQNFKKRKRKIKRPIVQENKENFSNEKGKNNHGYGCGQGN